jgi:anti-sigma B factor antagonist
MTRRHFACYGMGMDDTAARPGGPVVVVLPAEIDVTNSDRVHEQLVEACAPGVAVVIADLTSTHFCDSSGVHAIMHAYERAAARDIRLWLAVPEVGSVHRVLQLTGVGRLMPVYPTLQDAVSAA